MTRRAEESEKWIESHEEMTKEMESMREKFKNSETQNKNLQSKLENSKTTISEMECLHVDIMWSYCCCVRPTLDTVLLLTPDLITEHIQALGKK